MMQATMLVLLAGLPMTVAYPTLLDDFGGHGRIAAGSFWKAGEGTPPAILTKDGRQTVLKVDASFADNPKLKRAVIDRTRHLNLVVPANFTLEMKTSSARPKTHVTLYFRSGKGWFGASASLTKPGWQRLTFSKESFRSEDHPTGWRQIDGIRIAVWRNTDGTAENMSLLFRRLATQRNDVALIVPDRSADGFHDSRRVAERIAGILKNIGIESDRLTESSLQSGALGDRPLAILAYNPRLGEQAAGVLSRYVAAGGKMLVCYSLPPRLGKTLGFHRGGYFKQKAPGDFASIRFETSGIVGLPRTVRQSSWNIMTATPAGHGARVIGRWYDGAGRSTGKAAWLLSDRGAYFSHIFLGDDPSGNQAVLAAILGTLHPPFWNSVARAAMEQAERIGQFRSAAALNRSLRKQHNAVVVKDLLRADEEMQRARRLLASGKGHAATQAARQCRERRIAVYLRSQPSPSVEARAWWNHSGTGAYPGDWDRCCKELAAAGFNMIIANMARAGLAHYKSDVLPRSAVYQKYGDQISQCVTAAHKYGLEVHVWKVNFNLTQAPKAFIDKMRRAGRTQVAQDGTPIDWLNPAHPENTQLELESLLEIVRKYNVDGIHFDYIRYPHAQADYSDYSRHKFEADTGRKVRHWPADCYSGPLKQAYRDWRCKQITRLVAAVHREAKKIRPAIKLSAAVFRSYPSCYETVGQDWPLWVRKGYLDFLCPMDYSDDDGQFVDWIKSQQHLVGGRIPIYPGIGATASRSTLSADRVIGQIHWTRTLQTGGFTVFNLSEGTARRIFPGFHASAGRVKAVPPHRLKR